MDWSTIKMFTKPEEKKSNPIKVILIIIGAVVAVLGAALIVYKIFKKYFTVTFECGDCDSCEEDCFDDLDECCDELSIEEVDAPEAEV